MPEDIQYYVIKKKAVPEVLLKVVEAKLLLDTEPNMTIADAIDRVGISRSSFYKYKDDISPFRDSAKGKNITIFFQIDDKPGLLSKVLQYVAEYRANVLTIHQSIPVSGIASLTISVETFPETGDIAELIETIEKINGIHYVKILSSLLSG